MTMLTALKIAEQFLVHVELLVLFLWGMTANQAQEVG